MTTMSILKMTENMTNGNILFRCYITRPYFVLNKASKRNFLALAVVHVILAIFAVTLNLAFLITMYSCKRLRKNISNVLLINLASIDFLVAVVVLPAQASHMVSLLSGRANCGLGVMLNVLCYSLSSMSFITLVFITLESYIAIIYPFIYERFLTIWRVMMSLWLSWLLVCLACTLTEILHTEKLFQISLSVLISITTVTFVYAYLHIYNVVKTMRRRISCVSTENYRGSKTDWRTIKMSITIVLAFVLSYLPVLVYSVLIATERESNSNRTFVYPWIRVISLLSVLI